VTATDAAIQIRPVTNDDLEGLIDIYLDTAVHHAALDPEVFHVPPRDEVAVRLQRRIDGRGATGEYVVAISEGEMAGSASVDIEERATPGNMIRGVPTAEFGVSVLERYRGRGIGRVLIAHLEAWAADHGIERMILNVSVANVGAIRLYHELGYRDYDRAMLKRLDTT
jgi:GNAT superfamily N-acetyltransferase